MPAMEHAPEYDEDFRRFLDAMRFKMNLNKHKGRWDNLSIAEAMDKLMGETKELEDAIKAGNMVEILLECADVANFAMIVSSIAVERGK